MHSLEISGMGQEGGEAHAQVKWDKILFLTAPFLIFSLKRLNISRFRRLKVSTSSKLASFISSVTWPSLGYIKSSLYVNIPA